MHLYDEPKIDTHAHVLDPSRFAYAPGAAYHPRGQEQGTLAQWLEVMPAYGIRHALLVGPNSGYGDDNRCLLDAIERGEGRFKGIAVVAPSTPRNRLVELRARGVLGVALNATVLGENHVLQCDALLRETASLDMVLSLQVQGQQLATLAPMVERSGVRTLIDHAGRPTAGMGITQPGFKTLLGMARNGRTAVKLSGFQKFSQASAPWIDTAPYIDALVDAFTLDACLWASDWPFLKAPERLDVGPLVRMVQARWPDRADRDKLFWHTPKRWLGF